MIFTEWNWDDALEVAREEGREEGREKGREDGLEEGIEKGREEGIEFIARNALSKGIPVQTVQEITGLSLEKIKELKL
jgi:predicted transposase/invertase (TIGR01784 family)